ncbi:MAG: hypothetical protein AB8I08_31895 [Sandaracinaceae bacterium]
MPSWPARFVRRRLLHANQDFRVDAVTDADGVVGVSVSVPDGTAIDAAHRSALERLAEGHRVEQGNLLLPCVAVELDGPSPHAFFDARPTISGQGVVRALQAQTEKVPYSEAAVIINHVIAGVNAARERGDASLCLSRLSWSNFIVDPDGVLHLLGCGHNVVCDDRHGNLAQPIGVPAMPMFESPAYGAGGLPNEGTVLYASAVFLHSMMHLVSLPKVLADAIATGMDTASDGTPLELWSMANIVGAVGQRQATLRETWERTRANLFKWGNTAPAKKQTVIARMLAAKDCSQEPVDPAHRLTVGPDEVKVDGSMVDLGKQPTLRRILDALLAARARDTPLDVWGLWEAGWPGDKAEPDSARNRVHVALSRLRRAGLGSCVERDSGGYRIGRDVLVERVP